MKIKDMIINCIVIRDKSTKEVLGTIDDQEILINEKSNIEIIPCITDPVIEKVGDKCILRDFHTFNWNGKSNNIKEAIQLLNEHINTYIYQMSDEGFDQMIKHGLALPDDKQLFIEDAEKQVKAYQLAIKALKSL